MTGTTEIYLVRHGQSIHNQQHRIAGQLDSELTAEGFEDARNIARSIGRSDFDIIYSSDLRRARQTAEAIKAALHLTCPIQVSPLLRELDYGEYTEQSVADTFGVLDYKKVQHRPYPGGESFQDLERRVSQFVEELRQLTKGQRVLVTAHAGSVRIMAMQFDPAHRQQHLETSYGNRFLGRVVLDENGGLISYEILQNPMKGGF